MIATASYHTAQRAGLTIVCTSVTVPRWLAPLPILEAARPFGIFGQGLDWPTYRDRYLERLADRWDEIERDLDALTREWPRIALGCYCPEPRTCHRRLLADAIEQHGLGPVHELPDPSGGTTTKRAHNPTMVGSGHVPAQPSRDAEPAQMSLQIERTE